MQHFTNRKTFFLSLLALAVLFSYVCYLFLSNVLDPNNYKEEIARQIENGIGKKVYIGGASLNFTRGIGVRLGPVRIFKEEDGEEIFSAESVTTLIKVLPLLKREIQIRSVILNAPVFLLRLGSEGAPLQEPDSSQGLSGQKEPFSWRRILPMVEGASSFRVQKARLKIVDKEGKERDRLMDAISFDLEITKGRKGEEPYFFDLGILLKYTDKKQGNFQLEGGIFSVPDTLDFRDFGFHAKVEGKNIDKEFLSLLGEHFSQLAFPLSGSFDLNASFVGNLSKKMETEGAVEFLPHHGIYKEGSSKAIPVKLKFAAQYHDQSLSLKKLEVDSGGVGLRGKINVEQLNTDDPLVALDLMALPVKVSVLRENIYYQNLPDRIQETIGRYLTEGDVSVDSLIFTGPWSLAKEGRWSEIQSRLALRLSLSGAEGLIHGENGPVPFRDGSGRFLFEKNMLSLEGISFDAMENRVTDLNARLMLSEPPRFEDATLKSDLHLEKLGSLLEKFFSKETIAYSDRFEDLKGTVHATLHLSSPGDGSATPDYSGEAVFDEVSFYHRELKIPVQGIKGSMQFSSQKKPDTIEPQAKGATVEREGIFLEFKDISASARDSEMLQLSGNYQSETGKASSLSLRLKGILNLAEVRDSLWPFILKKSDLFQGYQPKGGKTEFDMEIMGEADKFLASGNLRLINASFQSPFPGFSPEGLNGRLKLKGQSVLIEDLKGELGASEFSVSGNIDKYMSVTPGFDMNIYLKGEGTSLQKLLLANTKENFLENSSISGSFKAKTKLKGTPEKFSMEGSMDFTDFQIQSDEKLKKTKGKDLSLAYSGTYLKNGVINVGRYECSYLGSRITGKDSFFDLRTNDYVFNLDTEKFSLAALLDFFSVPDNSSAQGSIGASLTLSGSLDRTPFVRGKIQFDKLGYHFGILPVPLKEITGSISVAGEKLDIHSLSIKYEDSEVRLSGTYEDFHRPRYALNLDSPRFQMNDILPLTPITILWLREFLSESERFRNTDGKIFINVQDGKFKFLRWRDLTGTLAIKNKVFTLTDAVAKLPDGELLGSGHIGFLSEKGMDFLLNLKTISVPAERIMYILGPGFDDSLTGNYSLISSLGSEGYRWEEVRNSLHGSLVFLVKDGMYTKQNLLKGMKSVFGFGGSGDEDKKQGEAKEFYRLGGKFEFDHGIGVTDNFAILSKKNKTSMVGKILLGESKLDLSIGVAPWAQADKIVSKIPIVGTILAGGDEKSLLTAYYEVKGDMSDPKINALPFKSIGKKFEGIFKGILNTPLDIQDMLIPKKGEK